MAIPKAALRLRNSDPDMGPADVVPFAYDARRDLPAGDTVSAFTATLAAEAAAAGVELGSGSRATGVATIDGVEAAGGIFWLSVNAGHQADAAFAAGIEAAVQIAFSHGNPAGHRTRTCVVNIRRC